jgi:ribosomal protein S3AE
MPEQKTTKVIIKKKKFQSVEIPLINSKVELVGDSIKDLKDKNINLDLTRQLKGKSVEAIVKIKIEDNKAVAYPNKIKLMPYFIKRMIRKRISYIEDSFETPSQESLIRVKPFLITRKKVSRAVRKALRNRCKNWIEDYIAERKDNEIFNEILSNKMQRALSLVLKKTYPLSLCEIRILEITRPLKSEEVPEIKKKKETAKETKPLEKEIIDQIAEIEIEKEKKEKAEKEIEKTQEMALKVEEGEETPEEVLKEIEASGMPIPDSTQKSKISDTSKNLGSLGKENPEEPTTKKAKRKTKANNKA